MKYRPRKTRVLTTENLKEIVELEKYGVLYLSRMLKKSTEKD
ncbi:hypothetical protein WN51_00375 [Melipona quadrifasciata]|uniref:Uncharacterized protein n=1 Tax=Melipona quadrifasciata TaxID=166423 RepID=A0A0M9A2Z3_9HYME|nr:hypothetical protein WN51_00375 [Melipona quadrifasciata]